MVSVRTASEATDPIVSPFDPSVDADVNEKKMDEGPMELTLENVEKVFCPCNTDCFPIQLMLVAIDA